MNPGTKDEIKGDFHEVKAKSKEGRPSHEQSNLQADGRAEHTAGKLKEGRTDRKSIREVN